VDVARERVAQIAFRQKILEAGEHMALVVGRVAHRQAHAHGGGGVVDDRFIVCERHRRCRPSLMRQRADLSAIEVDVD
jgi:hypothetical protein